MKRVLLAILLTFIILFSSCGNLKAREKNYTPDILIRSIIAPKVIPVRKKDRNEQRKSLFLSSFCFAFTPFEYEALRSSKSVKEYKLKYINKAFPKLDYRYNYNSDGLLASAEIVYKGVLIKSIDFVDFSLLSKPIISGPKKISYFYDNRLESAEIKGKFKILSSSAKDEPLKVTVLDFEEEIEDFFSYEPGDYTFKLKGETLTGDTVEDVLYLEVKEPQKEIKELNTNIVIDLKKKRPNEIELKEKYLSLIKDLNLNIEAVDILSTSYKTYDKSSKDDYLNLRIKTTDCIYNDIVLLKKDKIPIIKKTNKTIIIITGILVFTLVFYFLYKLVIKCIKKRKKKNA